MGRALLEVRNLRVEFPTRSRPLVTLDGISFTIKRGKVLGVVGESGAGKSMIGAAIIQLIQPPGRITHGQIIFDGRRIDELPERQMRRLRGRRIGAIFQDPLATLNPLYTIGRQLSETMLAHLPISPIEARRRAVDWLDMVGISSATRRVDSYPHELSGGMRQRAVIALALCAEPSLVIADEPTTALDVSIQGQIIALLKSLSREWGMAMMLISHDIGVIAEMADDLAVIYAGRAVEIGPTRQVIDAPLHPYSAGLIAAIPPLDRRLDKLEQIDGVMPRLADLQGGCAFNPRCPKVFQRCRDERPELVARGATEVACWLGEVGLHDA